MNNNQPTKIVSNLYKRFITLNQQQSSPTYWIDKEQICEELKDITTVTGSIEVMSKNSIIKLCAMQSDLRFMPMHTFLIEFSKTVEFIK